jgi:Two-component sensor kinase N-terminal.
VLGIGGMVLIQRVVETTHDRLLDGSVLAIAERVGVEDGELTVDLPQVAGDAGEPVSRQHLLQRDLPW